MKKILILAQIKHILKKLSADWTADNFKKCLLVHDYIYANNLKGANGFAFSALDTTLVFYTAIAAAEKNFYSNLILIN